MSISAFDALTQRVADLENSVYGPPTPSETVSEPCCEPVEVAPVGEHIDLTGGIDDIGEADDESDPVLI